MNFSINETTRENLFQLPLEVELLYSLNGDSTAFQVVAADALVLFVSGNLKERRPAISRNPVDHHRQPSSPCVW